MDLGEAGAKAPSEKRVSGRYWGKTVAVVLRDRLRSHNRLIINRFAGRSQQIGAIAGQIAARMRQIGAFTELFAAPMRQIGAMTEQFGAMTEQFAAMTEQIGAMTEQIGAMTERFAAMAEQFEIQLFSAQWVNPLCVGFRLQSSTKSALVRLVINLHCGLEDYRPLKPKYS